MCPISTPDPTPNPAHINVSTGKAKGNHIFSQSVRQNDIEIFAEHRRTILGIKKRGLIISKRDHGTAITHSINHFQYGCVILVISFRIQNRSGFVRLI